MKVVILAGGYGSRLSEETELRPKPLVEIGGKPILWHIMKIYSHHGFNEFVICLGYKGYAIKEYFCNYYLHQSDITIDLAQNTTQIHNTKSEPWKVTLVDTGTHTMTGGRIKKIQQHIGENPFMLTYGDGVGNVDIGKLVAYHENHGKTATITSVEVSGRFGSLTCDNNQLVRSFKEKPQNDGVLTNGGFFVLNPSVFDLIPSDQTTWENEPLEELANQGQLVSYKHSGFWHPMDTLREKNHLENLWKSNTAPWKIWSE